MMQAPAPPAQALDWLSSWESIGGGVTIGVTGKVQPWRMVEAGTLPAARRLCDAKQTELLREMEETPGLIAAVRIIQTDRARKQLGTALRAGVGRAA
jgi:hypothetical protein